MQLIVFDWLANLGFSNQENGLMSLDGVCVISVSPVVDKTRLQVDVLF